MHNSVEFDLEWDNAGAESVHKVDFCRSAVAERRCLVLADDFYEWKGEHGHEQPCRTERTATELFAFAGLWECWSSDGDELQTVTIVATESNEAMASTHDGMPVNLEPDEEDRRTAEDDPDGLHALLDPYPDDSLDGYTISKTVNESSND